MNKTDPWTTPDRNQSQTPTVVLTLRAILAGVCSRWNEWEQFEHLKWGKGENEREPGLVALLFQLAPGKEKNKWGLLAMFSWSLGGIQTTKLELVSSIVRYEVMTLFTGSVWDSLGWYFVVQSQYEGGYGWYLYIFSYHRALVTFSSPALRALGLLLADVAPTVGRGKTFWRVGQAFFF